MHMIKSKAYIDHGALIAVLLIVSSVFFGYLFGQTGWSFFSRSLLLIVAFLQLMKSGGRAFIGRKNGIGRVYFWRTTLVFGYILIVGFIISILQYRDLIYSVINLVLFSGVFTYLIFIFWRENSLISVMRVLVGFAVITSIFTLIEAVDSSLLPPMQHYIDYMSAANAENNLLAGLVSQGQLKAFGIFQDAMVNGMTMAVAATFLLARALFEKKHRMFDIAVVSLLMFAIYFTRTRNCYLVVGVGVVTLLLVRSPFIRKNLREYPKMVANFWMALTGLIMLGSVIYVVQVSGFDLENTVSSRVYTWSVVFTNYILDGHIGNILFGYGISQWGGTHQDENLWALDNLFIQIFMYSGFLGLCAFIYWWLKVSKILFNAALASMDYLAIATYAAFNQFLLAGVYNSNLYLAPVTPLILIFGYLVCKKMDSILNINYRKGNMIFRE